MGTTRTPTSPAEYPSGRTDLRARPFLLLCVLPVLAYLNSLHAPFIFDDTDSILTNPSLRRLSDWRHVLWPPSGGLTVSGRPLVHLSLALNWAVSQDDPWSYHPVNLLVHLAATGFLFAFLKAAFRRWDRQGADNLAFTAALLWSLHPLQTESVTYVAQRAESMMGACYLAVLYGTATRRAWLAILACWLGMACKEVMVSAPVLAFLYDWAFETGSAATSWTQRRGLWLGLMTAWIPLAAEVALTRDRGGTAGFGTASPALHYGWTQGPAIVRYLSLVVWPHPLVLDYGVQWQWIDHPWTALPANLAVLALLVSALALAVRVPRAGFWGLWFFAVLAPTSIVPGARQTLAEHRMYLALAPVLVLGVLAGSRLRLLRLAPFVVAPAFLLLVVARNRQYASPERLWEENVAQVPANPGPSTNLGTLCYAQGRRQEALAWFGRAVEADPDYAVAQGDFGVALLSAGRIPEAIEHDRLAVRLDPDSADFHDNLALAYQAARRYPDAEREFARTAALRPTDPLAEGNWALVLAAEGRAGEAIGHYRRSLSLDPGNPQVWLGAGVAYFTEHHGGEAIDAFRTAVRLRPDYADAWADLGSAYGSMGRTDEGIVALERAERLNPALRHVHSALSLLYRAAGRYEDAAREGRRAEDTP